MGREPFGGPLRIRIAKGAEQVEYMLGVELAEHIVVSPVEQGELVNK